MENDYTSRLVKSSRNFHNKQLGKGGYALSIFYMHTAYQLMAILRD
jgi:hypothetical protein